MRKSLCTQRDHKFWEGEKSFVFVNRRLPKAFRLQIAQQLVPQITGHLWFTTSGSSGMPKYVALSKEAFLASAASVNTFFSLQSCDVWINPLPAFHVGGLSIWARAFLAGSRVVPLTKWCPKAFCALTKEKKGTIASLVPTQVYDLVSGHFSAPPTLLSVVVGGGKLEDCLYEKAKELGWNLIRSYGMTECASQIANEGRILKHMEVRCCPRQSIWVKGTSLLTCYGEVNENGVTLSDPKVDGWLETGDVGGLNEGRLVVQGRREDVVKVGGELVSLPALRSHLARLVPDRMHTCHLTALPESRLGSKVHIKYFCSDLEIKEVIERFNQTVLPFERIQSQERVKSFSRSPLGKLTSDC